jgi:hypothetical protein
MSPLGWADSAWIGLRYWCPTRSLSWVTGEELQNKTLAPWAQPWNRDQHTCSTANFPFMGVYYYRDQGRWQAVGPAKRFPYLFVEFPAPKPSTADPAGVRE